MESKLFKKIVSDFFTFRGFTKDGNHFYRSYDEISVAIGLQKSNYSNSYYINIGYIISALNPPTTKPHYVNGNVRAGFMNSDAGIFDLEKEMDKTELILCLEENMGKYITGVTSINDLRKLIELYPDMKYQTTVNAKHMLGLD